jgi:hypothetical protein
MQGFEAASPKLSLSELLKRLQRLVFMLFLELEFRLRWQRAPSREAVMTAKKLVKFASAARE